MLETLLTVLADMAWPAAITIAWIAGEAGYRWLSLPRISSYGVAGFFMAASQGGFLADPWLGATSMVEAAGTFAAVFMLARAFAVAFVPSLLLAERTTSLHLAATRMRCR